MISQSLIAFLSPETNCKIVRILLRYALIYIIASQLVSLQDVFHLAVQFSKYILRPSRFARWLPARIFQILCAFRFAFAHPPKIRFLSIPENDTGSRRRTVIRPSFAWIFFFIQHFRAPHSFRCDRPGMNESVSFSVLSLERR